MSRDAFCGKCRRFVMELVLPKDRKVCSRIVCGKCGATTFLVFEAHQVKLVDGNSA